MLENVYKPSGIELRAYKVAQSGGLGARPSADVIAALAAYDKSLSAIMLDGKWRIFRWRPAKWAISWPQFVASVVDENDEYRNLTTDVVAEIRDFCDVYGPRWNGDVKAWLAFLDKYENDKRAEANTALDNYIGEKVDRWKRRIRYELKDFIMRPGDRHPGALKNHVRWGPEGLPYQNRRPI